MKGRTGGDDGTPAGGISCSFVSGLSDEEKVEKAVGEVGDELVDLRPNGDGGDDGMPAARVGDAGDEDVDSGGASVLMRNE